jgi:hypothetical protein
MIVILLSPPTVPGLIFEKNFCDKISPELPNSDRHILLLVQLTHKAIGTPTTARNYLTPVLR